MKNGFLKCHQEIKYMNEIKNGKLYVRVLSYAYKTNIRGEIK
jgi:hypothetical protein